MSRIFVEKCETDDLTADKPYRVELILTPAEGITANLFVLSVNDDWQHVASADDIDRYPETIALASDVGFYRVNRMTRAFQRKVDRSTFVVDVLATLRATLKVWQGESAVITEPVEHFTLEAL